MSTPEELFQQAFACHQAGRYDEAEAGYRAVLAENSGFALANHNLGVVCMQRGEASAALPYLTAALDADPSQGQFWLSYIEALARDGQRATAQAILDMARQQGLEGPEVDALLASLAAQADPEVGYCPVCGDRQASFLPLPDSYREQARLHGFERFGQGEMISLDKYTCQRCGASDRERIYALWLDSQLAQGKLQPTAKVLHFAPEAAWSNKLRQQFADYTTADFAMDQVDYKVDLQALPFVDESYDLFLCSHVLEHVPSDDRAIRELYRITRKGGCGILVAPISLGLERTVEDPSVTDEAGRWRLFGQNDHVRLYAHDDYVEKIRSAGFRVEQLGQDDFGADVYHQLGMKPSSILYIVYR